MNVFSWYNIQNKNYYNNDLANKSIENDSKYINKYTNQFIIINYQ